MKINKNTINTLIELEKKYGILSQDHIDQEKLFEMQDELSKSIADIACEDLSVAKKLKKELPFLFKIAF